MNNELDLRKLVGQQFEKRIVNLENVSLSSLLAAVSATPELHVQKIGMAFQKTDASNVQSELSPRIRILKGEAGKELLDASLTEAFKTRMQFLSVQEKRDYRTALENALRAGNIYEIVDVRGSLIGAVLIRELEHEGKRKGLVSWIWSTASRDLKPTFLNAFQDILANSPFREFVASIHVQNIASLGFFSKAGFRPICLFLN